MDCTGGGCLQGESSFVDVCSLNCLRDNAFLDKMGFATLAECVENCDVIDRFEMKHAEKPNQVRFLASF